MNTTSWNWNTPNGNTHHNGTENLRNHIIILLLMNNICPSYAYLHKSRLAVDNAKNPICIASRIIIIQLIYFYYLQLAISQLLLRIQTVPQLGKNTMLSRVSRCITENYLWNRHSSLTDPRSIKLRYTMPYFVTVVDTHACDFSTILVVSECDSDSKGSIPQYLALHTSGPLFTKR